MRRGKFMIKLRNKTTRLEVTEVYEFGDYLFNQTLLNGEVVEQWFSTKNLEQSHPFTYKSDTGHFKYYEDTSFLESQDLNLCIYQMTWKLLPKKETIIDISEVESVDLNKVLLINISVDGRIYKINSKYPLPIWEGCNYTDGGYKNKYYNLSDVVKRLKSLDFVKNIETVSIPIYNQFDGSTAAVQFDYKLPENMIRELLDSGSDLDIDTLVNVHDIFNLKSFRKN